MPDRTVTEHPYLMAWHTFATPVRAKVSMLWNETGKVNWSRVWILAWRVDQDAMEYLSHHGVRWRTADPTGRDPHVSFRFHNFEEKGADNQ